MDQLLAFLLTPIGGRLVDAVIGLLVALTAYLTYKTHEQTKANGELLNDHLKEHLRLGK